MVFLSLLLSCALLWQRHGSHFSCCWFQVGRPVQGLLDTLQVQAQHPNSPGRAPAQAETQEGVRWHSQWRGGPGACSVAHTHSHSASTMAVRCEVARVAVVLCWCYIHCLYMPWFSTWLTVGCVGGWWMCLLPCSIGQTASYKELYWLIVVWQCTWYNDTRLHEGDYDLWKCLLLGGAHENSRFE